MSWKVLFRPATAEQFSLDLAVGRGERKHKFVWKSGTPQFRWVVILFPWKNASCGRYTPFSDTQHEQIVKKSVSINPCSSSLSWDTSWDTSNRRKDVRNLSWHWDLLIYLWWFAKEMRVIQRTIFANHPGYPTYGKLWENGSWPVPFEKSKHKTYHINSINCTNTIPKQIGETNEKYRQTFWINPAFL